MDRILALFETLRGTRRYYAILHVIRTKIIFNADRYSIRIIHIGHHRIEQKSGNNKRDIWTLEYQLTALYQGNKTIKGFYQRVYQHLPLILHKGDCLDFKGKTLSTMKNTYREKTLATIIRGLIPAIKY